MKWNPRNFYDGSNLEERSWFGALTHQVGQIFFFLNNLALDPWILNLILLGLKYV
jgi:hypothetical protein